MKRVFSAVMFILLLTSMLTLAFNIQPVKASGTIYIRADGSIDPPTAPISTVDNVTYILTGNISSDADGIVVERSNIIIDGDGCTISGTGTENGFYVSGITNVTIKNTNIKSFLWGIRLYVSSNSSIFGNNITANNYSGIMVDKSSYNSISGNNITANNREGIMLEWSSNNSIFENSITNSEDGINLYVSSNNTISGNSITNSDEGIWLAYSCYYNSIVGNNITANNYRGIYVDASHYNSISGNNITANALAGITLGWSSDTSIFENSITGNERGVDIYGSSNSCIYHNDFIDNTAQVYSSSDSANVWDDGYPSGGNYWSDYTGFDVKSGSGQDLPKSDGIGDTPYVIDADNQDRYPLIHIERAPWSPLPVHNMNTGLGYATIQEAINAPETLDGQTIFVETGAYYENVVVNKSLTLIGEKSNDTIIDGMETGTVIVVEGDFVTINNFTIRNSRRYDGPPQYGIYLNYSFNTIISDNIITDHWFGVYSYNSSHLEVANNLMFDNNNGIHLYNSFNSTIADNTINSDEHGIRLEMSNNTDIMGNFLFDNPIGILIYEQSWNSKVISNVISNSTENGLELIRSGNSMISNNLIADNARNGLYLFENTRATIIKNNLTNNGENGIYLVDSGDNIVYHNNFINNTEQTRLSWYTLELENTWDNGYPSGGNYWSDYDGSDSFNGPYQNLTGTDGIGDAPYVIDANNTDRYPLINLYFARARLSGDVNDDGKVNMRDLMAAVQAFNSFRGYPRWNADADLDGSGRVTMRDLLIIVLNFNKHQ